MRVFLYATRENIRPTKREVREAENQALEVSSYILEQIQTPQSTKITSTLRRAAIDSDRVVKFFKDWKDSGYKKLTTFPDIKIIIKSADKVVEALELLAEIESQPSQMQESDSSIEILSVQDLNEKKRDFQRLYLFLRDIGNGAVIEISELAQALQIASDFMLWLDEGAMSELSTEILFRESYVFRNTLELLGNLDADREIDNESRKDIRKLRKELRYFYLKLRSILSPRMSCNLCGSAAKMQCSSCNIMYCSVACTDHDREHDIFCGNKN